MKILMLSTYDKYGGAAIAATRLMHALSDAGTDVSMIVMDKQSEDTRIMQASTFFPKRHFYRERLSIFLANRLHRENLFAVSIANCGADVTGTKAFAEADVIHLHWVNQGLLSLRTLDKIMHSGKPVVWTMHDMWPLTGICHYAQECSRFTSECGNCPLLYSPQRNDLSRKIFCRKKDIYAQCDIRFVAVGTHLAELAKLSTLLKDKSITIIPNMLDTGEFRQKDKAECRKKWGLPQDKDIILFGAARIDDPIKGFEKLTKATSLLRGRNNIHLLLFGRIKHKETLSGLEMPFTYAGTISGTEKLSELYSAADISISASSFETFGQTIIESMSCGCVPVAFDSGGPADIIIHKENGFLTERHSPEALAEGIEWGLSESGGKNLDRNSIRAFVENRYSGQKVAVQYIRLYSSLTKKEKGT